ncbi:universal stress protein [Modestobacter marinus]|uniref:Nucleotide-binding universal stress UspA family protein n=1 Tax=Modestobacter marinus TaxID=477641 RepID=A0A846M0L0_9ACTN|nr:universal stress protein [Modestobacter marinus]NIH69199.1 nucleotide-binding universal stress UspA family protein [Modestobacter marinus]GGL76719.1 universal stress protein [Modestobacter marinus]
MTGPARAQPKIVVGVDGSPSSRQALRWAAGQAQLTGAQLHAVTSWRPPGTHGWETPLDAVDWAADARRTLDTAVEEVLSRGGPSPGDADRVTRHVLPGHPAEVLLAQAADADLLVVGSRGHGGFTGMLLGSVGLHVIAHAACPVLVVRGDRPPPSGQVPGTGAA